MGPSVSQSTTSFLGKWEGIIRSSSIQRWLLSFFKQLHIWEFPPLLLVLVWVSALQQQTREYCSVERNEILNFSCNMNFWCAGYYMQASEQPRGNILWTGWYHSSTPSQFQYSYQHRPTRISHIHLWSYSLRSSSIHHGHWPLASAVIHLFSQIPDLLRDFVPTFHGVAADKQHG